MQVKKLNQTILGLPDWAQFLRRSSIIIAVILLGSALITAIAANWISWPKPIKVLLIQATITALVIFAWKRAQQKPKDWATAYSLSSLSINLAAIAIGGLLALIGQSYQTGADPWQLFALWALLLLPWLLALRSLFIILLILTLTNIALFLFFDSYQSESLGAVLTSVAINFLFLLVSHQLKDFFADPYFLIRRFSVLFIVLIALALFGLNDTTPLLIGMMLLGALGWYYLRYQQDVLVGGLGYGGAYVLVMGWLIEKFHYSSEFIVFIFLASLLIGLGLIFDLRRVWRRQIPINNNKTEPWFLRLFYLGIQLVITVFSLLLWWMVVGQVTDLLAHVYVLAAVVGIVFLQRQKNNPITQDMPLFLLLSSMAIAAVGLENAVIDNHFLVAWFIFLNTVVFVFSPQGWLLRFCSGAMATLLFFAWLISVLPLMGLTSTARLEFIQVGLLLLIVALAALMRFKPNYNAFLQPLWWAWILILLWLMASPLLAFMLNDTSQGAALTTLMMALPALVLFAVLWSKHSMWFSVCCAAALGLVSLVGLANIPLANFALLGWMWAYARRDSVLFWCSVLVLTVALGQHYYVLQWPLINKAFSLALGGLAVGLGALLLHRVIKRGEAAAEPQRAPAASDVQVGMPKYALMGLWTGLGAVLLISTQDVARKEYLLAYGVPVVLRLAPVDPRSLMQGDYMALSFTLGQRIKEIVAAGKLSDVTNTNRATLLAYVQPSRAAKPSEFIALKDPRAAEVYWLDEGVDTNPQRLDEAAVLSMEYRGGRWLPNGIDAWFFPEGQAAQFEQARYGEFKTNAQGRALLYKLID